MVLGRSLFKYLRIFLPPNPTKENLLKRQEFILLVIMSFILVYLTCDSGVIM